MSISLDEVRKVALLSRIALTDDEEERFAAQLNDILDYVEQLNELDVEGVEPTTRAIDVSNVMRQDAHSTYENREGLLNNAPDRDEDFFKVPKILNS
ncbi:MAG: Asp-tRNA(Asn)/Glu-tRNA(Gln) amidotransferase subunit GatC [Cyanobacteria bacterium P01_F01_bin.153]